MKRKIHLTGAAHLDPVWLWDWREGFQANKATLKSALDRMMEFDDFVFTTTSAQFYEWIEENEPEMFEKIRQRVKEGRWVIAGGWWIEPDCNIPSGESFARQGLLAQRYFYEKFGVTAKAGMCPDSFGHNGMLPQLLKKSGMENYIFMRPMPHENPNLPSRTFLWQSPDGSQVKVYRIPFKYSLGTSLVTGKTLANWLDEMLAEEPYGVGNTMGFVGTGNHGGGPTIRHIEDANAYRAERQDVEVVWSHPNAFFAELEDAELPVVADEIQYHAPGCYAVHNGIKDLNRKAENALLSAEKFSTVSALLGKSTRKEDLDHAWKQVLFNQFHDIMAGTATENAYFDARNQLGEALSIASRCENNALQAISFDVAIPYAPKTVPIVVYNPHSWEVKAPVVFECGMFVSMQTPVNAALIDEEGNRVPLQMANCPTKVFERRNITFMATVPPLGYRVYRLVEGDLPKTVVKPEAPVLENDFIRVEFDNYRGTIASIYHKGLGKYVLKTPSRARVIFDDTDTWGHLLTKLDAEVGEFGKAQFLGLDTGAVRTAIRFRSYHGDSILTQNFILYRDEDFVRVESRLNWREKRCVLKLDFTLNAASAEANVEIPFGTQSKKTEGREEAMQCWCDLSGEGMGLAIANNNKYSVDFRGSTVGLTCVRSQAYVHHDPYVLQPEDDLEYIDYGVSDFKYIVKPHAGDWKESDIRRIAMVLNQPPVVQLETFHEGDLPMKKGFISVDKENVLLSALKEGYDGDGTVLRLFEGAGEGCTAAIRFMDTAFTADFGPYEVKTFLLKDGTVTETDLLEWTQRHG